MEAITKDFVTQVEVCCDLYHPNLVRLLGYADRPRLMIMQELLRGSSMDKLLYMERWVPTGAQVLKAAHDVARGMEYLHTMFESDDNTHIQPIIHRDLKSPNLLLATRPMEGEGVLVKVTDFGLSRDKALSKANADHAATAMMTGCGSILWMAPEILLGRAYNEKVDVYSYAMCLVELVDCALPWSREGMLATAAEVPMKVTRGMRPRKQVEGTADSPVDPRMANLIRDCWSQNPDRRPDFTTVILRLEEMMGIAPDVIVRRRSRNSRSLRHTAAPHVANGRGGVESAKRRVTTGMLTLQPLLETAEDAPSDVESFRRVSSDPARSRPASPGARPRGGSELVLSGAE